MKILHVIRGKANKDRANGVNQVIVGLCKYTSRNGAEVRVVGKAEKVSTEGEIIDRDGFFVQAYSKYSLMLRDELIKNIRWSDIVHLHGLYSPWNIWVSRLCQSANKPYVVTLHDGLAKERLKRGRFKKVFFHLLLQKSHLENASGIHVLTEEESTEALLWFKPNFMFCIPNGIDLEDYPAFSKTYDKKDDVIKIGFLGRISPEKNILALCEAVKLFNLERKRIELEICGPDSEYLHFLLKQYQSHGIKWVGAKFGESKRQFLKEIDLFVHPSHCDVFSITAMEVLATGTPLVITRTSNASYFYDSQGFIMCEPTVYGLKKGIEISFMKKAEWPILAKNGRELVEKQFNWKVATDTMITKYDQIILANS